MAGRGPSTRIAAALLTAAMGGCYSASVDNGTLLCSVPERKCPSGYHCATDGTCWHDGQNPGPPDMASAPDLASTTPDLAAMGMNDLSMGMNDLSSKQDLAGVDLRTMPDLSRADMQPVVGLPAPVWLSSGGGPSPAMSGAEAGISLGGVVGTGLSGGGASCTFGYLFSGSF
jgi:hypothetical protein